MLLRQLFNFCCELTRPRYANVSGCSPHGLASAITPALIVSSLTSKVGNSCSTQQQQLPRQYATRKDRAALVRVVELLIQQPALLNDPQPVSQPLQALQRQQVQEQLASERLPRPLPPPRAKDVMARGRLGEITEAASGHWSAVRFKAATSRALTNHFTPAGSVRTPTVMPRSTAPSDRKSRMYNRDRYTLSPEVGRQIDHLTVLQRTARGDGSHTHRRQVSRSDLSAQRDVAPDEPTQGVVDAVMSARRPVEHRSVDSWYALTQANPWERGTILVSASSEGDERVARAIPVARGHRSNTKSKDDVRNARLKEIESQFRQLRLSQRQIQPLGQKKSVVSR